MAWAAAHDNSSRSPLHRSLPFGTPPAPARGLRNPSATYDGDIPDRNALVTDGQSGTFHTRRRSSITRAPTSWGGVDEAVALMPDVGGYCWAPVCGNRTRRRQSHHRDRQQRRHGGDAEALSRVREA